MRTLGQIAVFSMLVLPMPGQWMLDPQNSTQQAPVRRPSSTASPRPVPANPVLPTPNNAPTPEQRIDKRRDRMKGRDGEIDRILKQRSKRN